MGHHAERTLRLYDALQRNPGRSFTCAQLSQEAGIPKIDKKFVRRALTVDPEAVAKAPMDGVRMWRDPSDGLWRFQAASLPPPPKSN
jgi:hypothetical protein